MENLTNLLRSLRRPRLLVRAARFGLADYNRNRDLKRLFRGEVLPGPGNALPQLVAREEEVEANRKSGAAAYSVARHIEILIALIAEVRLLPVRTEATKSQANASGSEALRLVTNSDSASTVAGSMPGASYSRKSLETRVDASIAVSRSPSSYQVSNGL